MASPFRAFRKHQKTLLAIACLGAMIAFVIGTPMSQSFRGSATSGASGRHNPDDVVVRWKDGKLTNAEMSRLIEMRLVVHQLIREIEAQGRGIAMEKGQDPRLRVEMPWQAERP